MMLSYDLWRNKDYYYIINWALSEKNFPIIIQTIVHPLPKKPLPDDDFQQLSSYFLFQLYIQNSQESCCLSYPVSRSHLLSNSLSSSFQSAYCMSHSTTQYSQWPHLSDRASSKLVWSSWHISRLVSILSYLPFSGSLHPKFHFIFLKSFLWCISSFRPWPTFYTLYTIPFDSVSSKNSTNLYHLYVDDTQLYISVIPSNSTSLLGVLSNTFSCILSWIKANKSLLNPPNTEFPLVGTKQQRLRFSQLKPSSLKWQ